MKQLMVASMLAGGLIFGTMAIADQSETGTETHHVKNATITTKVKSKLAAKHLSSLTNIKVDTDDNGVVWLSGRAPNKDAVDMATLIAKGTDGVTSVHNDIAVQPKE